jgi:hypothetical protein
LTPEISCFLQVWGLEGIPAMDSSKIEGRDILGALWKIIKDIFLEFWLKM